MLLDKMGKKNSASKKVAQKTEVAEVNNELSNNDSDRKPFKNRQRVLVVASRGVSSKHRHLLNDLKELIPHSKKDVKVDTKSNLSILNEACEMRSCNNCVYLESRRSGGQNNLFMWLSKAPHGPSMKFHVTNIHTLDELKLTGNCLKGSRHILSFDKSFETLGPAYQLMKEVISQTFNVPYKHLKSKPFVDHILQLSVLDGRIWFRNYQIIDKQEYKNKEEDVSKEDVSGEKATGKFELVEIGPRFVLTPVRVFGGSFGGQALWDNPQYVAPRVEASLGKRDKGARYVDRQESKRRREELDAVNQETKMNLIQGTDEGQVRTLFEQVEQLRKNE